MLFFLFISTIVNAQQSSKWDFNPNLQVGMSGGTSIFFGDIKQQAFWPVSENNNEWRFAYGLNFNYNISPVFTIRFQGLAGELSGSDRSMNTWFENDYYELNLNTTINFNNLFGRNRDDRFFSVYGVMGFGLINYNTVVQRMDEYYVLKRVGYGYGTGFDGRQRQAILLLGAGVDVRLTKRLSVSLETVNKFPDSDLIDGAESGNYNDLFNFTSLGLNYRFAFKKKRALPEVPVSGSEHIIEMPVKNINLSQLTDPGYTLREQQFQAVEVTIKEETVQKKELLFEFRVQILAEYGKPFPMEWISENYQIPLSEIKEDKMNGYYIYTTGSFTTFSAADEYRETLQTFNGIYEAFVVAFKDGKRVFPALKKTK